MATYSFRALRIVSLTLCFVTISFSVSSVRGDLIDLVYELDGHSDNTTSFGTVDLVQNGSSVDVEIVANIANLVGGDIHEFYFNLPDHIDISSLSISNSGGTSDHTITPFMLLGSDPNIVGGAGASFDTGINFGNGAGPPGNGTLTTATFSLTATGGLLVDNFLSELSHPTNVPSVFVAVHFQSADVFGQGSETVGGTMIPEPTALGILALGTGLFILRRRK